MGTHFQNGYNGGNWVECCAMGKMGRMGKMGTHSGMGQMVEMVKMGKPRNGTCVLRPPLNAFIGHMGVFCRTVMFVICWINLSGIFLSEVLAGGFCRQFFVGGFLPVVFPTKPSGHAGGARLGQPSQKAISCRGFLSLPDVFV